jgi:hypothetical protein
MQQLDYSNGRPVFSMWSMPRCYKQETKSFDSQFCAGVCEERTSARDREIYIVVAVTRKCVVMDLER